MSGREENIEEHKDTMSSSDWDARWNELKSHRSDVISLGAFAQRAFESFEHWIIESDRKILEAGSGSGQYCIALAQKLPGSNIIGVDNSKAAVELGNSVALEYGFANVEFIKADIFSLPFGDESFDVVFSEGVVEHFTDYIAAIREMIRVAKLGGKVIIAVPNLYCFPHTLYKKIKGKSYEYGLEKSFSPGELVRIYQRNGLDEIEQSGFAPTYGLERLPTFRKLGKFLDKIMVSPLDMLLKGAISRRFGFEIVIKGVKAK